MPLSRWSALLSAALVLALIIFRIALEFGPSTSDPSVPDRGILPPPVGPVEWIEVARLDPVVGEIIDIDARGDRILYLTGTSWALQTGDQVSAWIGDEEAGSPDWLGRPVSAALGDGQVLVLEGPERRLRIWNEDGEPGASLAIPVASDLAMQLHSVKRGPGGDSWVTAYAANADGSAAWTISRIADDGATVTVDSLPAETSDAIFRGPLLYWTTEQEAIRVDPIDLGFLPVGSDGSRGEKASWKDAPRWRVPRRQYGEYERLRARMPASMARHAALPDDWPVLRDVDMTPAGLLIAKVSAGEDHTHVIILDSNLSPVGRLTLDAFIDPVFLSGGRVFRVTEEFDEMVIHEARY